MWLNILSLTKCLCTIYVGLVVLTYAGWVHLTLAGLQVGEVASVQKILLPLSGMPPGGSILQGVVGRG